MVVNQPLCFGRLRIYVLENITKITETKGEGTIDWLGKVKLKKKQGGYVERRKRELHEPNLTKYLAEFDWLNIDHK